MPQALINAAQQLSKVVGQIGNTVGTGLKTINNIDQQAAKIPEKTRSMVVNGIETAGQHDPNAPPPVLPPTRMPTSNDTRAAQRQSIIDQLQRRGRASTILTDNTDTLG